LRERDSNVSVSKDDVTVVLPTLNEEEAIGKVIEELEQVGYHNILVVDGYSTDRTAKIAGANGCCVVLQHSKGKCGAIETAIENVKTPYMLVMDGDCSYDPKDIESLLAHCEKYDQIIGVRTDGRTNIPRFHRFGNALITKTFNLLMGTKLSDVCSGMYLISADWARRLHLDAKGFDVEVEIAAQTATNGRITEVPIAYRKRVGLKKLNGWKHGFQIVRAVFGLARVYNPAFLFSVIAVLAGIPASVLLGSVTIDIVLHGAWHGDRALFGIVLFLVALQTFTIASISLLLKRMERRVVREVKEI
jgi:dolichol-phosphate mannosyltransferase